MQFVYDDGGRSKYFKAKNVDDCVCRAIAIGTGMDYKEVYELINKYAGKERRSDKSSARNGVHKDTFKKLLKDLGWVWHPTMTVGSGCTVHLDENELPSGTLIVSVSKHLTCVKDGVIHDTYDCSRDGSRCVYGYFTGVNKTKVTKRECEAIIFEKLKEIKEVYDAYMKESGVEDDYLTLTIIGDWVSANNTHWEHDGKAKIDFRRELYETN